jgi:hypothetical protein
MKNEPAFPAWHKQIEKCHLTGMDMPTERPIGGLTIRQYYAGLAMQGMELIDAGKFSAEDIKNKHHKKKAEWAAAMAVEYADALIKALEESDEQP